MPISRNVQLVCQAAAQKIDVTHAQLQAALNDIPEDDICRLTGRVDAALALADRNAVFQMLASLQVPSTATPTQIAAGATALAAAFKKQLGADAPLSAVRAVLEPYKLSLHSRRLDPRLLDDIGGPPPRKINERLEKQRQRALQQIPPEVLCVIKGERLPTTALEEYGISRAMADIFGPVLAGELSATARRSVPVGTALDALRGDDDVIAELEK
jgi:hypothetical protein